MENNQQFTPEANANTRPVGQLDVNRSLLKYILLSIVTLGIYAIVKMSAITNDINIIASRYDGKKTMHYCLLFFVITPLTCGIGSLVWSHKLCNRIGGELKRRGIDYSFSASDFWLWCILGSLILVGPFVYIYKMFKSMNLLSENYNNYG